MCLNSDSPSQRKKCTKEHQLKPISLLKSPRQLVQHWLHLLPNLLTEKMGEKEEEEEEEGLCQAQACYHTSIQSQILTDPPPPRSTRQDGDASEFEESRPTSLMKMQQSGRSSCSAAAASPLKVIYLLLSVNPQQSPLPSESTQSFGGVQPQPHAASKVSFQQKGFLISSQPFQRRRAAADGNNGLHECLQ